MILACDFRNIIELNNKLNNDTKCHQWVASKRWGDGIVSCAHCYSDAVYIFKDGIRYKCKACSLNFTAKTNSFMSNSNVSTIKWINALWLSTHKKGISSYQLAGDIGVTQKTAWFMLQRIRFVMGQMDKETLAGTVQLDETFVGGKNINRHHDKKVEKSHGRSFKDKTPVLGMLKQEEAYYIERPHKVIPGLTVKEKIITSPSRLICAVVPHTGAKILQPIIKDNIKADSTIVSDEWMGYKGLHKRYNQQVVDHGRKQYVNEQGYTSNALEGAWKTLKASVKSIYHQVSPKHLNKYVNEFEFRYNNRNLASSKQMDRVLQNMDYPLSYKQLIA